MSLSLLAFAGAASFACLSPSHHDGDNIRCANIEQSIRLQGIDAPEMPGSCRRGRACTPGDPYVARDTLRALTAGHDVRCTAENEDNYGRIIARCSADGTDLSCAMIAAGQAVPRYAKIACDVASPPRARVDMPRARSAPYRPAYAEPGADWRLRLGLGLALWLALANGVTWVSFAIDKRRAQAGRWQVRIPESRLLGLAAAGGTPAAWHAINRLRHKSAKSSFKLRLIPITGLQIAALLAGLWWSLGL